MTNKRQGTSEKIFQERRINGNQFLLASLMTMTYKYSHQDANKIMVGKQISIKIKGKYKQSGNQRLKKNDHVRCKNPPHCVTGNLYTLSKPFIPYAIHNILLLWFFFFFLSLNWNFFCKKDYLHINNKNALSKKWSQFYLSPQKGDWCDFMSQNEEFVPLLRASHQLFSAPVKARNVNLADLLLRSYSSWNVFLSSLLHS